MDTVTRRRAWDPQLYLFPELPRPACYDQRALDVAEEHQGLRFFYLGWPLRSYSPHGGYDPGDFLVVLGHPEESRVLDLVGVLNREYGNRLLSPLALGQPDSDDIIQSYATVSATCPDADVHDEDPDEGVDPCWTCDTQCYGEGLWYLDWYKDTFPDPIPANRFPVWIFQINTSIGWR